ncbi:hypothetical protein HK101_008213, partial [Irineochytrium annulatum]
MDPDSPLVVAKRLTAEDRRAIFAHAAPDPAAVASARLQAAFTKATGIPSLGAEVEDAAPKPADGDEEPVGKVPRRPPSGDDNCPICYETMSTAPGADPLVYCPDSCGNPLHRECFEAWKGN